MLNLKTNPQHTSKIYDNVERFSELVHRMESRLTEIYDENPFSMLAGCGNSAMPLLGALGLRLKMPIISVRKIGDPAHDWHRVNGHFVDGKYLIIDDLISSGETVDHIRKSILTAVIEAQKSDVELKYGYSPNDGDRFYRAVDPTLPQCAGILLYHSRFYSTYAFVDLHHGELRWKEPFQIPEGPGVVEQVPCYFIDK